jgi:hypothetical protein
MDGFLLIQTRPAAMAATCELLERLEGVVQVEQTAGPYDIIVSVRAVTERAMGLIRERANSFDGVLRVLLAPRIVDSGARARRRSLA